jgi:predicted DCC family thiol-disulfide oxidoreductase YuxK
VEAQEMLNKYSIDKGNIDSIVLIVENEIFFESDAVLYILKNLGGIWNLFSVFKIVPKKFRDLLYKFIAVRRHKIFGRRNECMIPDENIRDRFI